MTRPNENREFWGDLDLVIEPGKSSMFGDEGPKRYFQILEGSCLVRYGSIMHTVDGRRIIWAADGGGMEEFARGDVFGAGDGRIISLRNVQSELAVVHEIKAE
jgi:hypothetical protein